MIAGATLQLGVPVAVGTLLPEPGTGVRPTASGPTTPSRTPTGSARPTPIQTTGAVTMSETLKRGVVLIKGETDADTVAGTGMVISPDGEVLTNYHVVRSTRSLSVTVAATGRTYAAKLVGRDATKDVALLKLTNAQALDTVVIDRDPVAIGDVVVAAGNANGQGFVSANRGNILGTDQVIQVKGPTENDPDERLTGLIETNAPGWPGDSGGPMFDAETQVLGMTTAGSSKTEDRRVYAIPIASALGIVERIRADDETGSVVIGPKAFLGVVVKDATGEVVVSRVDPGTPASRAGLRVGDTITRVGDASVTTRGELSTALDGFEPGSTGRLEWRTASGRERSGDVTFGTSKVN